MAKVPFELVSIETDKILSKMLDVKDQSEANDLYHQYFEFLKKSGWTEEEFDKATTDYVNKNWAQKEPTLTQWTKGPSGQKMELKYNSPISKKN